jgi:uncharacterized protein YqeY
LEIDLKSKLNEDLKKAMKGGDTVRRSVIRLVFAAIKNTEIAKQNPLSYSDILGVLSKEAKQREESILAFKQGNRQDLVSKEEAELAIIKEYLPEQISRDEIVAQARRIIQEVGAQGPRDKGKVMPKLMAELKGKADGREINDVVTELLSS